MLRGARCSPPPIWSTRRRSRRKKRSGPVVLFARNQLCVLARPGVRGRQRDSLLDRMLDAGVKLGTSTPLNDPAGDYAWEVFHKADALKPGAFAALEKKGHQTGRWR